MNKKITIAIDGFSSTGKSTIAKQLAKKLDYIYVDSGAMYRAVTWYAMQKGYISNTFFKENKLVNKLSEISLSFHFNEEKSFAEIFLNGLNVENEIRSLAVSKLVSSVSAISKVRKKLVAEQQEMAQKKNVVMDGRDIGTVVFPNATLKLFITASANKRAERRYKELIAKGDKVSYDDVLENIVERDRIDSTRKDSPLKKAVDAIEFDNSEMGLEAQFEQIYSIVKKRLQFKS